MVNGQRIEEEGKKGKESGLKQEEGKNVNVTQINDLNDDCLRSIFEFLQVVDWLSVEVTCRRWQLMSASLWRNYRKFDSSKEYFLTDPSEQEINFELFRQVFVKCAPYVTDVNLSTIPKKNQKILFDPVLGKKKSDQYGTFEFSKVSGIIGKILLRCSNIEELTLDSNMIDLEAMETSFLQRLLERNKKIRFLNLVVFDLRYADPLLSETLRKLETLILLYCFVNTQFLDVDALRESEKLRNLCLYVDYCNDKGGLYEYFRPSENLVQLSLSHGFNCLGATRIVPIRDLLSLRNLKVLSVRIEIVGNEMIVELCNHCKDLVAINMEIDRRGNVTDVGLRHINASLKKLVCLKISFADNFTDEGLRNPNKNLRVFSVPEHYFTDEGIINFLQKTDNLEVLDLSIDGIESSSFIHHAIDIMKSRRARNNFTPLEIGLGHHTQTTIWLEEIENLCPLLKFNTEYLWEIDYSQYIDLG